MKKIIYSLALIVGTISFSYADTDKTSTSYDGNAYFDIGLGAAKIENLPTGAAAINMNWGYNFNRGFALEAGWAAMPSNQWGHLDNYNIFDIAAKGTIPFNKTFDLYGKLGVAGAYSSWTGTCANTAYTQQGSAWGGVGLATIGVAFNLNPSFSLYLENNNYIPFGGQPNAFGYTTSALFGFQYNFGQSSSHVASTYPSNNDDASTVVANHGTVPADNSDLLLTSVYVAKDTESAESVTFANVHPEFAKRIMTDDDGNKYIIVQKGDTLSSVSCGVDSYVTSLQAKNNLKNNIIVIGRKLYIDNPSYIPQNEYENFNKRIHMEGNRRYFEAICGDDLLKVSRLSGIDYKVIAKSNNMKNANRFLVGEKVYLDPK